MRQTVSPIPVFFAAVCLFEFAFRLPYSIFMLSDPIENADIIFRMFGGQDPQKSIFVGIVCLVSFCFIFSIVSFSGFKVPNYGRYRADEIDIGRPVYFLVAFVFLAALASAGTIGVVEILSDVSKKRQEVSAIGVTWILVKISLFAHIVACMAYVRFSLTGKRLDLLFFILACLSVVITSIVFSQRATIFVLLFELIFVQLFIGNFSLGRSLKFIFLSLTCVLTIGFLRPSASDASFLASALSNFERLLSVRYFMDFSKIGTVFSWSFDQPWLGLVNISFLGKPFADFLTMFYKDIGPFLASSVYIIDAKTGVTPGFALESLLSFGFVGGLSFFGLVIYIFARVEFRFFSSKIEPIAKWFLLLILGKFPLLINSSLGAFSFQLAIESLFLASIFLIIGMLRVLWNRSSSLRF